MERTDIRVIYGDTDMMGVVYYATYLRYFEAARNEFIRAKGLRYRDFEAQYSLRLPVIEAHVSYKQPARYDDLITVEIALAEARRASARFDYRILRDGVLLVTGHTVHACVDLDGRVHRMPVELIQRLGAGDDLNLGGTTWIATWRWSRSASPRRRRSRRRASWGAGTATARTRRPSRRCGGPSTTSTSTARW